MTVSSPLIKAIVIFPLNVMGVIPLLILWFSREIEVYQVVLLPTCLGLLFIILGLCVCWVTVAMFTDYGKGTPAPWAPPKILIEIGLYRYVRNPMMLGVWCVLLGEAVFFLSVGLFLWFLIFVAGSLVVIPLWEEADLGRRFGEPYLEYKKQVPRWVPRILF